jgi:hypothetical protein
MARKALSLIEGLESQEYRRRVYEARYESAGRGGWRGLPNELVNLVQEIRCQNGAEDITTLLGQLIQANITGGRIRVGGSKRKPLTLPHMRQRTNSRMKSLKALL